MVIILRRCEYFCADRQHPGTPATFDEGEHGPDLIVGELAAERGHVALIVWRRIGRHEAALRDAEQHGVGVVPRVSLVIMRRRGHAPVWLAPAPVELAFQLCAVACGAML